MMISARPRESASRVAKRWKTLMGSSELNTVTPELRMIREVLTAMAASTVSGVEMAKSSRWCSPRVIASIPTSSARTASSTTLRITSA